jgi:hypothetical protein
MEEENKIYLSLMNEYLMTMYKLDDLSIELIESKQEENKTHLSLIN